MIIYKDILTGDEMFSDSFKITSQGPFYVVKAQYKTESNTIDDSLIGGNASKEEAAENVDDSEVRVLDVVSNHKLIETAGFEGKKAAQVFFKDLLKRLKAKIQGDEELKKTYDEEVFKKDFEDYFKSCLKHLGDLQWFHGNGEESGAEGLLVPVFYGHDLSKDDSEQEETDAPHFFYFKHAVYSEKF